MRYQGKYMETSSKCAELDVFVRALLQAGSVTVTEGQAGGRVDATLVATSLQRDYYPCIRVTLTWQGMRTVSRETPLDRRSNP